MRSARTLPSATAVVTTGIAAAVALAATVTVLTLALTLALTGDTRAGAAGPVRLTVGVATASGTLDTRAATSEVAREVAREVWRLQYPTLTALDLDTLAPVPGIASSWTGTPDRRTWTYTLRPDATWSDGAPVTAADVVYSLDRARAGDWPAATEAPEVLDALTARALDDRTVQVSTAGPPGALPSLLVHVVPRHAFDGAVGPTAPMVGAGNWNVVEETARSVTMQVVDRPGRPALDEIVFRSYDGADALVDALAAGEVDVAAELPNERYARVRGIDGVQAIHANDGDQWVLQVGVDDADLRAALVQAFDRERLVARVAAGVGRPQSVPRVARGYQWRLGADDEAALAADLAFSPDAAEALRAIWEGDRPRAGAGPLRIASDTAPDATSVRDFVVETLARSGVETATVGAGEPADLVVARRDPGDDPAVALAAYTCAGEVWCDAAFDADYERLTTSTDPTEQAESVRSMARRIANDGVEVVLFAPDRLQAFRTDDVVGLLRRPEHERLVVFWPSPFAYEQVVPTSTPGGETIPTATFAVIALSTAAAAVAAYVGLVRRRDARAAAATVLAEGIRRDVRPGAG